MQLQPAECNSLRPCKHLKLNGASRLLVCRIGTPPITCRFDFCRSDKAPIQQGRRMYLDEEQADAVLDVVQHTKEFVAVWNAEQRRGSTEASQEVSKRKAISQAAYQVIMDKLLISYYEATEIGVSDDLLLEVIDKILPSDLEFTISIDHS